MTELLALALLLTHFEGDIVRIGPNELSFVSTQSHQDINGGRSKGQKLFPKTDFFDNGDPQQPLARIQDPAIHAEARKAMAPAFSAKSIRSQEDIIHLYMDKFVQQLSKLGEGGKKAINVAEAFNWFTFDVIGWS
jgi:cytochrome P450